MATQDSRIKIKRSTVTSTVPTVPSSNDHTDGTWIATDIYKGELFFNQADGVLWSRDDSGVVCLGGSASLTIASADVLTLNTTPLTIVGAVAGYAIEVVSASVKIDNPGAPYATNVGLELICNGATVKQAVNLSALNASVTSVRRFSIGGSTGATDIQLIANADLLVQVPTGDPTGGDADITVFVNYRLIPV
jgi:hypothetical protein